uniref:Ribonuclease R n=1 Tax=uncultured Helicobacter sp. TaxID=175537 RepID=A0A650EK49_9HELI|nr:ribonuclease R [uncultured Helicobacter sp.]
MLSFYALIATGCPMRQIHKSFIWALERLKSFGVLEIKGDFCTLKSDFVIGSIDISRSKKVFLKSFNPAHTRDWVVQGGFGLKKGDVILAKINTAKGVKSHKTTKKRTNARYITTLFSPQTHIIALIVMNKGRYKAFALSNSMENVLVDVNVSQKSLKVLPKNCVVKLELQSKNITEVLGVLDDAHIDEKIVLGYYDKQEAFSEEALKMADSFGQVVEASMYPSREDLRHLPFCVIDPIDAKDHDDAIYFDSKTRTLYVAIADVSEYVSINSVLDNEARKRGFSIYFPHKVVPMLPFALSAHICSLLPNEDRLAMVWQITLDENAQVIESRLFEAIIKSYANVSYEQVNQWLNHPRSKHTIPKSITQWLKAYIPYVQKYKENRLCYGYEFNHQEIILELNQDAFVCGWHKHKQTFAHSIIEESMLLANTQSAKMLQSHTPKALFRIHPPPKEERIRMLMWELENLGFEVPDSKNLHTLITHLQTQSHNETLRDLLDSAIIRSFAKATYSTTNVGHFGLGFESYTHFTSPIRRYSDLVVHRILKAILHQEKNLTFLLESLNGIAEDLNVKEKQISHIEQYFYHLKMLRYATFLLEQDSKPLMCQALVIDEISHCVALDIIPEAKILLPQSLEKFTLVSVEIVNVDRVRGIIYGEIRLTNKGDSVKQKDFYV